MEQEHEELLQDASDLKQVAEKAHAHITELEADMEVLQLHLHEQAEELALAQQEVARKDKELQDVRSRVTQLEATENDNQKLRRELAEYRARAANAPQTAAASSSDSHQAQAARETLARQRMEQLLSVKVEEVQSLEERLEAADAEKRQLKQKNKELLARVERAEREPKIIVQRQAQKIDPEEKEVVVRKLGPYIQRPDALVLIWECTLEKQGLKDPFPEQRGNVDLDEIAEALLTKMNGGAHTVNRHLDSTLQWMQQQVHEQHAANVALVDPSLNLPLDEVQQKLKTQEPRALSDLLFHLSGVRVVGNPSSSFIIAQILRQLQQQRQPKAQSSMQLFNALPKYVPPANSR